MLVYSSSFLAMNTRFAMVIPGMEKKRGEKLARGAEKVVENWEQCLSAYRSGAELQIINSLAAEHAVVLSEPMLRAMDICHRYTQKTSGLFDPAVNQNKSGWRDVTLNLEQGSIFFKRPGVKLDMGGIGKGIALEDVVSYFKSEGLSDAFISFGESSIAGMGKHPHGDGWLVGTGEGFLLRDAFISVSGLQDLNPSGEKEKKAHIYHPLKQELIRTKKKVVVRCDSAVEAEVLSTCAYMADESEFEQLKCQFPAAEWRVEK
jgi:thiamine biosynthesis lipoprotein